MLVLVGFGLILRMLVEQAVVMMATLDDHLVQMTPVDLLLIVTQSRRHADEEA